MSPGPLSAKNQAAHRAASVSILLVDDDERNLLALEAILSAPDHHLVKVQTAEAALLAVMEQDFAVLVLDVKMPDFSGIELARLIKQRKKTQHIPIILLTAYFRENEHAILGYDAGAVDYLTKPVNPAVLRSKVGVFIDLFRKNRELLEVNRSMEAEILERKAADERFRVVFELSPSAKLVFDKDGRLVVANSQAERLFGRNRADLIGLEIRDLVPSGAVPDHLSPLLAQESAGPGAGAEMAVSRGGEKIPVEVSVTALQAAGGMRWLVSLFDVTERRTAENALRTANEELAAKNQALEREAEEKTLRMRAEAAQARAEAANSAKDRFLAMLSHELRTPLAAVLNSVELLDQTTGHSEEVLEALGVIRRNVRLEARLIDDLLDLGRIRAGKLKLQLEPSDAHALLRYALDMLRPEIDRSRHKIEMQLDATRSILQVDPARLQQVFWNLINNAVKYTPDGGTITLRSKDVSSDAIQLEVSDTGIGLESSRLTTIFDAFEQVQSHSAGLGLGLAICKSLAEFHGGEIHATSHGLDRGATFVVRLPGARASSEASQPVDTQASHSAPARNLRLLVVEDHVDTATTLSRLLRKQGHDVQCAHSVAAALDLTKAFVPEVLLTDMGLPDGSGDKLFSTLRTSHPELVGIAITGFGMEEDVARSRAVGFSSHFTKPIDFPLLRTRLNEIARTQVAPSNP